ncbi:hypothetical protein [Lysinibacillus sphaericus]|uniref:hypothetical protein n=1 Tax=Lysinibacillus sphaericus TaxID=1421 RepID=UPI0021064D6B|nr:hypothetical protein [Lysinibacillus sp. SDF0037]
MAIKVIYKLLELISDLNIYEENQEQLEFAIGSVVSRESNKLVPILVETDAEAKVKIRKVQQKYKEALASIMESSMYILWLWN